MTATELPRDSLGDRMKRQYEQRAKVMLPRRTFTIIRLDGKAFHSYTRGRKRPWDEELHDNLVRAAVRLYQEAQGCVLGFVQSDEVSILLTDFATTTTEAWFDGNVQKMASVSASVLTAHFNIEEGNSQSVPDHVGDGPAFFDSRVFTIPDPIEVHNYFVWRQKDIERNSLSMLAQHHYSQQKLHGKGRDELHDMLHAVGVNWNDQPEAFKRGTVLYRTDEPGLLTGPAPIFTAVPEFVAGCAGRQP